MATIRGHSAGGSNFSTGGNVAQVAGTVDGDRVYAFAWGDDTASAKINPTDAGWTNLAEVEAANGRWVRTFERVASGDPANYAWDNVAGGAWQARLIAIGDIPAAAVAVSKVAQAAPSTASSLATTAFTTGEYVGNDPLVLAGWDIITTAYTDFAFGAVTGADGNFGEVNFVDMYLQSYIIYDQLSGHPAIGTYASTSNPTGGSKMWESAVIVIPTSGFSTPSAPSKRRRLWTPQIQR